MSDNDSVLNDLLEKQCYVIDFLPKQVPKDADGQFFKIENYLLNNYERYGLRDRFIRTILKLMCYYRITVHWGQWLEQAAPELIAEIVDTIMENHSGYLNMLLPDKNALLIFEWDCLNLTLYNPDTELIELAEQLARSEGLFCWRPEEQIQLAT